MEWIQLIAPEQYPENLVTVSGEIALADGRMIARLSNKKFNQVVTSELFSRLEDFLQVPGTELTRLTINGYGAPMGNYKTNEVRATVRAMELKTYLLGLGSVAPASVDVSWEAEDWEGIRSLIATSDYRLKDAALDIIKHVDVSAGREKELSMLGGGSLYARLQQNVFPQVCRLTYTAVMTRQQVVSPDTPQGSVSLAEMFRTAQGFPKGSAEFNDLIALSARIHPGNGVACINAAGVALMNGDLQRAGELLSGFETDPRALNNYGVYDLLEGETSKAEVYLMMAAANEVPKALIVLRELNR